MAISAAMPDGTGLLDFKKKFPKRFFDVGIAEAHGVTFAAGLAKSGLKPVVAIYSTFLQRAYDEILHDVCINNLPVLFAIDRAGIVGQDGETHQGIFDLSFLSHIPNMTVMAPKNKYELNDMLYFAYNYDGPLAIRYPRGAAYQGLEEFRSPIEYNKGEVIYEEEESVLLLAVGSMVETAVKVRHMLKKDGINVSVINARFVSPIDEELLHEFSSKSKLWVTLEENIKAGGFGERVSSFLTENNYNYIRQMGISVPDCFVKQGNPEELKKLVGLDDESIYKKIIENINIRMIAEKNNVVGS